MSDTEKEAKILHEEDFTAGHYRFMWEGSDPLHPIELIRLKELIEKWAKEGISDKTIALEAPRVLAEIIDRLEDIDAMLTGVQKLQF